MKLRQLQHLVALDEHGSFVQASAALHISQPALSRSIQALEVIVGAPLFLREGHGAIPTDLGRVLISRARQITLMADAMRIEVIGSQAVTTRELGVGAGPNLAATVVGRAAAGFVAQRPQTRLQVDVRNWDELLVRLRSHELDLFVAEISTLDNAPDLHVEPMSRRPIYFLARPGHPLAGNATWDIGAIFSYPTVALARIPPRLLDPMLASIARSAARPGTHALPTLHCTDLALAKQVVLHSDSIIAASLPSVADELERKEFAILGTEPWMRLDYGMVTLKTRLPLAGDTALFRDYLLDAERVVSELDTSLALRWATVR